MTAPGRPALAHNAPKVAPSDLPEKSRGLQEAHWVQRPPRGALRTPKEPAETAQEDTKMAQVGPKSPKGFRAVF